MSSGAAAAAAAVEDEKDKLSMRLLGAVEYASLIEEVSFFTERDDSDADANFDTRA
jgi:hypothetical protein